MNPAMIPIRISVGNLYILFPDEMSKLFGQDLPRTAILFALRAFLMANISFPWIRRKQ